MVSKHSTEHICFWWMCSGDLTLFLEILVKTKKKSLYFWGLPPKANMLKRVIWHLFFGRSELKLKTFWDKATVYCTLYVHGILLLNSKNIAGTAAPRIASPCIDQGGPTWRIKRQLMQNLAPSEGTETVYIEMNC